MQKVENYFKAATPLPHIQLPAKPVSAALENAAAAGILRLGQQQQQQQVATASLLSAPQAQQVVASVSELNQALSSLNADSTAAKIVIQQPPTALAVNASTQQLLIAPSPANDLSKIRESILTMSHINGTQNIFIKYFFIISIIRIYLVY